jgi:hypothetical protein
MTNAVKTQPDKHSSSIEASNAFKSVNSVNPTHLHLELAKENAQLRQKQSIQPSIVTSPTVQQSTQTDPCQTELETLKTKLHELKQEKEEIKVMDILFIFL